MKPPEGLETEIAQAYAAFAAGPKPKGPLTEELPLALSAETASALAAYLSLILRWNERVDLVSPASVMTLIDRHLIDSLAFSYLACRPDEELIDIGSGAGLPGLVSALARPRAQVVLCEPRGKRTAFLREAKRVLGLDNVTVLEERVETLKPLQLSLVTARAVGEDELILERAPKLLRPGGRLALMLGPNWEPTGRAAKELPFQGSITYQLPEEGARRQIALWGPLRSGT